MTATMKVTNKNSKTETGYPDMPMHRLEALPVPLEPIEVAAVDLDKTLYPPKGPNHSMQLRANINAMVRFEALGGFVFPVTGNNLSLAQEKYKDPDDKTGSMSPLRNVHKHPGIFSNGSLVLGPGGKEIEKQTLGQLILNDQPKKLDFVTALLDFMDS